MVKLVRPPTPPRLGRHTGQATSRPRNRPLWHPDNSPSNVPQWDYYETGHPPYFDPFTNPYAYPHDVEQVPNVPRQTKQRTIEDLKRQFEEGTWPQQPKEKERWIWRPGQPTDLPPFPTVPDIPGDFPDIPIPPQDKVIDDPFDPIDESEEAEDEGENVEDPGRDRFDKPPLDCQQLEMLGLPCTGNASLQIQVAKTKNELEKNKAYRKTGQRYHYRKTGYSQRTNPRRIFRRLGQSPKSRPRRMHRGYERRTRIRWFQRRYSPSIF